VEKKITYNLNVNKSSSNKTKDSYDINDVSCIY